MCPSHVTPQDPNLSDFSSSPTPPEPFPSPHTAPLGLSLSTAPGPPPPAGTKGPWGGCRHGGAAPPERIPHPLSAAPGPTRRRAPRSKSSWRQREPSPGPSPGPGPAALPGPGPGPVPQPRRACALRAGPAGLQWPSAARWRWRRAAYPLNVARRAPGTAPHHPRCACALGAARPWGEEGRGGAGGTLPAGR